MKTRLLFFLIPISIYLTSCGCEECGPLVYNPTFQAQFINTDSVHVLEDALEVLTESQSDLEDTISKLDTFIDGLIDPDSISDYQDILASFTADKTIVDSLVTKFDDNLDSVSQGYLIIEQIVNRDNGEATQPDTTNLYDIPLPTGTGQIATSLAFDILSETYNIDLTYESEEAVDNLGEVSFAISNIVIDESTMTFDTLIILDGPIYQFQF